jgi:hypothetical protein
VLAEHLRDARGVPDVRQDGNLLDVPMVLAVRCSELVQRGFGLVDEDKAPGAEPREPRAELRADRATRSGDEHSRFADVVAELLEGNVDERAAEERLDRRGILRRSVSSPCALRLGGSYGPLL